MCSSQTSSIITWIVWAIGFDTTTLTDTAYRFSLFNSIIYTVDYLFM